MKIDDLRNALEGEDYEVLSSNRTMRKILNVKNANCYLRKNGNYYMMFMDDGTKVRFTRDDYMEPEMPECIDMTITTECDAGCDFCYLNCTPDGKHADFNWDLLKQIPEYTEVAINVNDMSHPKLDEFLMFMKAQHVFVNVTINEKHLTRKDSLFGTWTKTDNFDRLVKYKQLDLIKGIGISVDSEIAYLSFVNIIKLGFMFPKSVVVHVIDGIIKPETWNFLVCNQVDVLILGYKSIGRGVFYKNCFGIQIEENINYLKEWIHGYLVDSSNNMLGSLAFDGLALDHLGIKEMLDEETFQEMYAGDEGAYTFYYDAVNDKYAISSITDDYYNRNGKSIKEMFDDIRVPGLGAKEVKNG